MTNQNSQGNNNSSDNRDKRGFASMDEDKQREIASKGGKAAHQSGNAHQFDSDSGREAGRKGGESRGQNMGQKMAENRHNQNDKQDSTSESDK
ncbi:KGG domain-containing protein [soil metagenome]